MLMGMTLLNSWKVAVGMVVGFLAYEALKLAAPEPPDWVGFATKPLAAGLFTLGAFAWIGWRQGVRHRDTIPVYQNEQTFIFTPGRVTHRGKGMETTFDLAGCHGVSESATHFTIWVTFASAYFVPLRAFASGEQVAQVRAWFRAGLPGTAKIKMRG